GGGAGRARRRSLTVGLWAKGAGSEMAAVGPAGDADLGVVDEAALLEGLDAGNDVAARTVPGVVPDGALVSVVDVVAAAIVRREDNIAAGGEQLGDEGELRGRGGRRPAVDVQDQRILLFLAEVGRVDDHAIFFEIVGSWPFETFGLAKVERGNVAVEIGEALWGIVGRRHVVELGRLPRGDARESNFAFAADKSVDPEKPGGIDVAQVEFFRRTAKGLQPKRSLRAVVAADQKRIVIR